MRFQAAPWSPRLKVASAAAVSLLAVVAGMMWHVLPQGVTRHAPVLEFLIVVPPLAVAGALLFMVRGYRIEGSRLGVERLLWVTEMPLDGLQRAWLDPEAMQRSLRIFGNGGLFAISGLFRSRALGNFRAFVTRPDRAVVLRTPSRVVVISPAEPHAFLQVLASHFPHATFAAP
jgi:hypothetical protein